MSTLPAQELAKRRCTPCEGGTPPLLESEARTMVTSLDGWEMTEDGKRIRRRWKARDFRAAIDFFNRIAELAEHEDHHPDLHLEGYRNVTVELTTHAIGGLSENDFILAAKIDQLPIAMKE